MSASTRSAHTRSAIADDHALHGRPAHDEVLDHREGHDRGAVRVCRRQEGEAQVEWVEDPIGHLDGGEDPLAERRLEFARFGGTELADRDLAPRASLEEPITVREIGLVDGDEEAAVELEHFGCDPREGVALDDALDGRLRVLDGVASPGVEEPVVPAGRSRRDLTTFEDRDVDAPEREVVRGRGAGRAAADDDSGRRR